MRITMVLALACLISAIAEGAGGFEFFEPLKPPRNFQVMARRASAPPNSSAAINLAIDDGLEWVAVDVRATKDARHVLFAHAELDSASNGAGPVKEHTLDELKKLDMGSWHARRFAGTKLITLAECLTLAKGKINVCLVCGDVDPARLVKDIQSAAAERQVLVSGERDLLQRVRDLSNGTIAVMPRWQPSSTSDKLLDELRPAVVQIDGEQVTSDVCRELHERGIRVLARMSGEHDSPAYWDRALAAGVDILQTDVSEEVIAHVLSSRLAPRGVRLTCHRGASRYAPENTLPAFEKAHRLHADYVEFDVRPSRDGKYFLLHDGNLDRTTDGKGPIRQSTAEVIESLDAGSWFGRPFAGTRVPSLESFLAKAPADLSLYFDAKDISPADLAAELSKHGLVERTIVYQSADYLEKLKQIDPRIRALPPASTAAEVTALASNLRPYAVDTRWNSLSQAYIEHCHREDIRVFADAPFFLGVDGYRQAIRWGIDLIQTDHPLRFWRAMELEFAQRAER